MTVENALQFLPLVHALAEGKTIEFNHGSDMYPGWVELSGDIEFTGHPSLYRVKTSFRMVRGTLHETLTPTTP